MIGILFLAVALGALTTYLVHPSNVWTAMGWWSLSSCVWFLVVAFGHAIRTAISTEDHGS